MERTEDKCIKLRKALINDTFEISQLINNNFNSDIKDTHKINKNTYNSVFTSINQRPPNRLFCVLFKNTLVGIIQFYNYNKNSGTIYLGYLLDARNRGKGIMLNACLRAIADSFNNYDIQCIYIKTDKKNQHSINLSKNLGFSHARHNFLNKYCKFVLLKLSKQLIK